MLTKERLNSYAEVFRLLALPPPEEEDLADVNCGFLMPLGPYACIGRLETINNGESARYPVGAMSIISYELKYYMHDDGSISRDHFGITPGTNVVGITEEERQALNMASMADEMLCVIGDPDDDFGYVTRTPQKFFPNGVPTLFDITDVVQVGNYARHRDYLYGYRYLKTLRDAQVRRYSPLRLLAHLMLGAQGADREILLKKFWTTMRKATLIPDEDGLPTLGAAWTKAAAGEEKGSKAEAKRSIVSIASAHYAHRLEHDPFHGPILELAA